LEPLDSLERMIDVVCPPSLIACCSLASESEKLYPRINIWQRTCIGKDPSVAFFFERRKGLVATIRASNPMAFNAASTK